MNHQPANDAVIDLRQLRNIDWNFKSETGKGDGDGDGGHKTDKSTSEKLIEEPLVAQKVGVKQWNTIFTISCAIAILVDPLYCYWFTISIVSDDGAPDKAYKCLKRDENLSWTYIGLRLAVDVLYAINFVWLRRETSGDFWTIRSQKTLPGSSGPKEEPLFALYLVLVSLPLPEALILSSICSGELLYDWDPTYALIISTPIQYSLRVYHIYGSLGLRRFEENCRTEKWLKAVLDYLPFVLASHLVGALWYRLAVQRQVDCWKPHCVELLGHKCKTSRSKDFFCDWIEHNSSSVTHNVSMWDSFCPIKETDSEEGFDFGIYLYALKSNVVGSSNVVRRISQSFWWALRNLSSFGSNLETSLDTGEIFFSVLISITGMALFLVYLNARVKESQSLLNRCEVEKKAQLLKPYMDMWLHRNSIKSKDLKKAIMENIHKLGENTEIDLQNVLSVLPLKYRKYIIKLFCLDSLKNVPVLENIHESILMAICGYIKPVTYNEDSCIVQEGRPLEKMIFIVQGLAWTYATSDINDTGKTNNGLLKGGDLHGEEVLTWAFESPSFSGLPISNKTVMSQGKIEAFIIRANDLKNVCCKFWWHFSKKVDVSGLEPWEHLATSAVQKAWRRRKAEAKPCP